MDLMADIQVALPEMALVAFGLLGVLAGAIAGDRITPLMRWTGAAVLFLAAFLAFEQIAQPAQTAFNGLFETTPFSAFARAVTFAMAGAALAMSGGFFARSAAERYEYALLVVFASLGAGVMLSANDLMTLYMGIETLSLSSYVLAAFLRDNLRSAEAGLKYFVLGALASGLLLYGASLVYGFAGGTGFDVIASASPGVGLIFGLVLMICGLAFKASAAPFHVWTPDVYEGAPQPVVAFFATAPKMAAVALAASVLFDAFGSHIASWRGVVAIIAALSMLIGAFGALQQTNIKRLLAYSSIANVGFALIAVAAGEEAGAAAVLVYMTLYVTATLGVFAGVLALRRNGRPLEDVADMNGLVRDKPILAIGLLVLIFSIAGIPPAAGFWGKVEVFEAALRSDLLWLVLVGALSSVISLGYYLRIIWAMMMKPAAERLDPAGPVLTLGVASTALLSFPVLTIAIQRLLELAAQAGFS
jgi:NADH-quinone oxidoreductase subunit N